MTVDSPRNGWIVLLSFTLNVKNVCIVLVCTTVHMHHLTLQYSPEGAEATHQLGWSGGNGP